MGFGLAETAKLAVDLSLKGNFKSALAANQRALSGFDSAVSRSGSRAYRAGQQIGTGFLNAGRIIALGAATAAAGLIGVLKVAGNFEAQLNTINTIARANARDLGAIGAAIRKVATDTGTPLADLTQAYYDLLSAGIKAADATKVLTAANTLAIGGLSTTAESVDLLTSAINTYGGDATKAAADADIFAKAIERGKVTAAELAHSFAQVGPIAAASGIELRELGAGYARLTAAGVPAAEAATQMRSAIVALTKVNPALEALQKQTGRNYLAIAGKKGLVEALQLMRTDATKAGVPLIDLLGRVEGLNFTLATTGPNFAAYNADLAAMGKATGTAAGQMAERQKGLNFQLSILKARLTDAAIVIGSTVLPKITPVFERLNKALADPKVISQIQAFGTAVASLFSDSNIEAGAKFLQGALETAKVAAPVVAQAAKATFAIVQAAVSLFTSLPKEIQGLAIGAFAINKLTGGLVTNIAGGLISSVLKQLVSGVVNVNGAVVNVVGGGGLPGAAAGAAGGGVSGAIKSAAKWIVPIAVAAAFVEFTQELNKTSPTAANQTNTTIGRYGAFATMPTSAPITPGTSDARGLRADLSTFNDTLKRNGERLKDDVVNLAQLAKATNAFLSDGFRQMVAGLKNAKGSAAIAAAVKKAVDISVTQGRGNAASTRTLLATLRKQLGATHDPKLASILRTAIAKVQAKLPGREFVAAQLRKADQILNSTRTTSQKVRELQAIEKTLQGRSLSAQRKVQDKIDAAKRAQVYAARATTEAIKDKDLSVTVRTNVNVQTAVSLRDFTKTYLASRSFGGRAIS